MANMTGKKFPRCGSKLLDGDKPNHESSAFESIQIPTVTERNNCGGPKSRLIKKRTIKKVILD